MRNNWNQIHLEYEEASRLLEAERNRQARTGIDQVDRELRVRELEAARQRIRRQLLKEPVDYAGWLSKPALKKWHLIYLANGLDPRWRPAKTGSAAGVYDEHSDRIGDLPLHPRIAVTMVNKQARELAEAIDLAIDAGDIPPTAPGKKYYRPRQAFEYLQGRGRKLPAPIVAWLDSQAPKPDPCETTTRPAADEPRWMVIAKHHAALKAQRHPTPTKQTAADQGVTGSRVRACIAKYKKTLNAPPVKRGRSA